MNTYALTTIPASGVRGVIARTIDVLGRFPLPLAQLFADEYRVPVLAPDVAATMATSVEIGCSLLLVAGLATRAAALPLLGMIAVIQTFVYPGAYSEHLTWASILVFLLTRGAGRWSLDHWLGLEPAAAGR